jgi:hypothetical protein
MYLLASIQTKLVRVLASLTMHDARVAARSASIAILIAACNAADARAANDDYSLLLACKPSSQPSQQEAALLFHTHNAGQTYAARARLMQEVRRVCLRGAHEVLIKADSLSREN